MQEQWMKYRAEAQGQMAVAATPDTVRPRPTWCARRRRAYLFALAMAMAAWGGRNALWTALGVGRELPPLGQEDGDETLIRQGLESAGGIRGTAQWWTGQWVQRLPYWRPLSSYGFWAMWKVFGWDHQRWWVLVHFVFHLGACALLFLLVEAMTGDPRVAALSVVAFTPPLGAHVLGHFFAQPAFLTVGEWKDCPDQWLAVCALGALLAAWRGRMTPAILLAALAAMFKETGFMVFPLVGAFYWYRHRRVPPSFLPLAGVAVALVAIKLHATGAGYVLGSNHSLWLRVARFSAGRPLNLLTGPQAGIGLLAIGAAIAVICRNRPWVRYGALVGAVLVAIAVQRYMTAWGTGRVPGYDVAMAQVLEPRFLSRVALPIMIWIVVAAAGMIGPWRGPALLFVLGHWLMGLPSTFAPQVGPHAYYTAWLLSSGATALCLWSLPVLGRSGTAARETGAPRPEMDGGPSDMLPGDMVPPQPAGAH